MTHQNEKKYRHFILDRFTDTERFVRPLQKIERKPIPEQDRFQHGTALLEQIQELKPEWEAARRSQKEAGLEGGFGLQIDVDLYNAVANQIAVPVTVES